MRMLPKLLSPQALTHSPAVEHMEILQKKNRVFSLTVPAYLEILEINNNNNKL